MSFEEYEIGTYTEDDTFVTPEYMLKMPIEELERRAQILFEEMKANPIKHEKRKPECKIKFNF